MRGATKKDRKLKSAYEVSNYRIWHKRKGGSRGGFGKDCVSARRFPAQFDTRITKATVFEGDCPVRRSSGA